MNKLTLIVLPLILAIASCTTAKVPSLNEDLPLTYEVSMDEPQTHYFDVSIHLNSPRTSGIVNGDGKIALKMPVWTPGSYLVREYAQHVIDFSVADANGNEVAFEKVNKNTWHIKAKNDENLTVTYKVYAYELTVRTSFLDAAHGYINGASVFMFVPELLNKPSELKVNPYYKWNTVSTALEEKGNNIFGIKDFDTLVDSPIEIGNQEVLEFEGAGVPHKVAMFTREPLNYNKEQLLTDYKRVTEAATSIFGQTPLDKYLFIIHHEQGIGGGLEHLFSTTCQTSPEAYESRRRYNGFFSLIAHEYFHLWNVKRIRPMALGPFDYENENYTHMLWVAEGFTSYYEEIILRRAGMIDDKEVLAAWSGAMGSVENTPGNRVQAVTSASWDAWIKYYRRNENSNNIGISYYSKGGTLASLLNLIILNETDGEKSLDEVLQLLYAEYYEKLGRGYTDAEFQAACEAIAGISLDQFFKDHIWDTVKPDYAKYYAYAGIDLQTESVSSDPYLGVMVRQGSVFRVSSEGSGYMGGLNVGDQIVAVDGMSATDLTDGMKDKKVGDVLEVEVKRRGQKYTLPIKLEADPRMRYVLSKKSNMNSKQEKIYKTLMDL